MKTGDDVAPAATVTEAGTPTPGSLLDKCHDHPPAGAATLRVTLLTVVETPPTTDVGDRTGVAMIGVHRKNGGLDLRRYSWPRS